MQSSMHKFPVNPRQSYSERMIAARAQLRQLVKTKLCEYHRSAAAIAAAIARPAPPPLTLPRALPPTGEITGDIHAQMRWTRRAYMKDIVGRYRVRIEGWPLAEVPFKNLSDVTNLPKLETLSRGWLAGTIYFRQITDAEFRQMLEDPTPWVGPEDGATEHEHDAEEGAA
ncbi:uncharacterized protein BXZ73DRAFT_98583 [Epithele typhae]|uniref:uncharacterized protein n=1 Tax=Epithele typhae TaxID=378194 RepID=UPI00200832FD|nr:uncharacterized protein BXZ73DRAFT_98583 [Epithele typhae]KAH9940752.1 hypothetical protein BXZ73DRAFT_98583 [Epithele typhae]